MKQFTIKFLVDEEHEDFDGDDLVFYSVHSATLVDTDMTEDDRSSLAEHNGQDDTWNLAAAFMVNVALGGDGECELEDYC